MNFLQTGATVLRFVKRNSPIIISTIAGIGLVVIYYLTIKETEQIIEEMDEMTEEEIHSFEMTKKIVKIYAPSFILLVFTLFCVIQTTVISQHRIRDLTTYSAGLATYYQQYRNKNIELNGIDADHEVVKEIVTDKVNAHPIHDDQEDGYLCLLAGYSHYFRVPNLTCIFEAFRDVNMQLDTGQEYEYLRNWMNYANVLEEYDEFGNLVPFDSSYFNYGWCHYNLTLNEAVSIINPYVGLTKDDSGFEYYFIDVPEPMPLEPEIYKF